jgi:hypothetical protein
MLVLFMEQADYAEYTESDSELNAAEKETTVTLLGDEKEFTIGSQKRTVVKGLLGNESFRPTSVTVKNGESIRNLDSLDDVDVEGGDRIVGVVGRMPVGSWTIKGSPRKNNNQSSIVSTTESVRAAREAFKDR